MNRTKLFPILACVLLIFIVSLVSLPQALFAKVTGLCVNCHTMHNSQNGTTIARDGSGTGWNGSGKLAGGSVSGSPKGRLLVSDCVGCHSSTTNQTIINIGGSRIPIVFNTVAPSQPLAGGNFYWVNNVNENRGHNVYGISAPDTRLFMAPGKNVGCTSGCHMSLASTPTSDMLQAAPSTGQSGCRGCHMKTYHHVDNGAYRFLISMSWVDSDHVVGIGDSDWEQTTSATKHNYYQGTTVAYTGGNWLAEKSITEFCAGCHGAFHGTVFGGPPVSGMGSSSPWIRHPTDIALPNSGEYGGYDPVNNYSVEAPVAWVNPASPVRAEAVVMCLSCHRAHGSPYPSMLRWDYGNMIAGDASKTGGCFTCHTTKH